MSSLKVSDYGCRSAEFTPDGERLVTGGGDGNVTVWDIHSVPKAMHVLRASHVVGWRLLLPLALDGSGRFVTAGGAGGLRSNGDRDRKRDVPEGDRTGRLDYGDPLGQR